MKKLAKNIFDVQDNDCIQKIRQMLDDKQAY